LEAISGVPFPTKDSLCTRFATELILRRSADTSIDVTIRPDQNQTSAEQQRLSAFRETLTDLNDFPDLTERAKEFMGLSSSTNAFSNSVLRVEISGPDRPHLTIFDLPGLIHSGNKVRMDEDVEIIHKMIKTYMAESRSVILAVVSAKNDYANQIVTKMAKKVDRKGYRRLGIIIKPDTLSIGFESELAYANLARNQDIEFRLG
jgi:hypothetical protein